MEQGAKVILMSHMGRPDGEPNMKYTLKPVADRLSQLLEQEVLFVSSPVVVDEDVKAAIEDITDNLNATALPSHVVAKLIVRDTPFEKTSTGKIKRRAN